MNIDSIKKIELEITSDCNAACPGCTRTRFPDLLTVQSFSLSDIKRLFPTQKEIANKQFKFCGVLGDPVVHPEFLDMIKYLTSNLGFCQVSTNGGYQNVSWWKELGNISASTKLVDVVFAVDGHKETNHIYRVNTVFDIIERNMSAYALGGKGFAQATWMFIVFDHNEHELEIAKQTASRLGFKFATRTGIRNTINDWIAKLPKRDAVTKTVIKEDFVITTSDDKAHSKVEQVKELQQFINTYSKSTDVVPIIGKSTGNIVNDEPTRTRILNSIVCKLVHEGEMFIASDLTLWPCCFLWQLAHTHKDEFLKLTTDFKPGWNSLANNSIDEILAHEWFSKLLEASWEPSHKMHIEKCIRTCGNNKAYQNEIKFINDNTYSNI